MTLKRPVFVRWYVKARLSRSVGMRMILWHVYSNRPQRFFLFDINRTSKNLQWTWMEFVTKWKRQAFGIFVHFRWILTKNYKELTKGSKSSISSFINIVMELKKCCNHAFLVRSPENSETLNKSQFEVPVVHRIN